MKRALTTTEAILLDKCMRYRRALQSLMFLVPDYEKTSLEYIAALGILGEDYGREGRCLAEE